MKCQVKLYVAGKVFVENVIAANYDIKRAIYNLGPTGYPFEILCAQMLMAKGYETKVSVIKKGKFDKS